MDLLSESDSTVDNLSLTYAVAPTGRTRTVLQVTLPQPRPAAWPGPGPAAGPAGHWQPPDRGSSPARLVRVTVGSDLDSNSVSLSRYCRAGCTQAGSDCGPGPTLAVSGLPGRPLAWAAASATANHDTVASKQTRLNVRPWRTFSRNFHLTPARPGPDLLQLEVRVRVRIRALY